MIAGPKRAPFLLAALACACGGGPESAGLLRLWTLESAELLPAPQPPDLPAAFEERFDGPSSAWSPIFFPGRSDAGVDPRFSSSLEVREGAGCLRLSGRHGGLATRIEVEPSSCYAFSGRVRASGLEAETRPFHEVGFYLGETDLDAPLAELLLQPDSLSGSFLAASEGPAEWQERERLFVTGPATRFLHVVCSLATSGTVLAGSAEFARLKLERKSPEQYWRTRLGHEIARRADVEPPAARWQEERRTSALVGGEHRPALVLLPGDRLRFTLPELGPSPRLSFGLGAWGPALHEGSRGSTTLHLCADGRALLARAVALPARAVDGSWDDVELDLAPRTAVLELECRGDSPLVVGAPLIHPGTPRPAGPNLLLISIDTLRADHVGAYGHPGGTTPVIDGLAREGVLCREATSQAPYTLPSHTTLFTGQFPSVHAVVEHDSLLSAARSTPLAEILARAGFTTQAFASGGFLNQDFGLDLGFQGFTQVDPLRGPDSHYFRQLTERQGASCAARLLDEHGFGAVERWLGAHADERFFLFLHTFAVHDYDAPERYLPCSDLGCKRPDLLLRRTRTTEESASFTDEMRAHLQHLYDGALRHVDERLGALLARLDELGLASSTLVVVTSDHGEEFFEHGKLQHGRTLYEELLRVPLILRGPGLEPRVIERPVMLADVVPTVLAYLGLAGAPHVQGVDLLGADWPARALWSEVDDRFAHKYALREERGLKVIHGPASAGILFPNESAWELYDLARDPQERTDLAGRGGDELERARVRLERQLEGLEDLGASLGKAGRGQVDEQTQQELDELGYGGE